MKKLFKSAVSFVKMLVASVAVLCVIIAIAVVVMVTYYPVTQSNCAFVLSNFQDEHGLSTKDLAILLDCSRPTVKRISTQSTFPTDEMIERVEKLLDMGHVDAQMIRDIERQHNLAKSVQIGALVGLGTEATVLMTEGLWETYLLTGIIGGSLGAGAGGAATAVGMTVLTGGAVAIGVAAGAAGYYLWTEYKLSHAPIDYELEVVR